MSVLPILLYIWDLYLCKYEPDIYIRQEKNLYEYIGVYVDDLIIE